VIVSPSKAKQSTVESRRKAHTRRLGETRSSLLCHPFQSVASVLSPAVPDVSSIRMLEDALGAAWLRLEASNGLSLDSNASLQGSLVGGRVLRKQYPCRLGGAFVSGSVRQWEDPEDERPYRRGSNRPPIGDKKVPRVNIVLGRCGPPRVRRCAERQHFGTSDRGP
jgi:hypothetical protein